MTTGYSKDSSSFLFLPCAIFVANGFLTACSEMSQADYFKLNKVFL
jgi:hypothetical protein